MRRIAIVVAALVVVGAFLLAFAGCGGDSSSNPTGTVGITVIFPDVETADKDMPDVTNSVLIRAEAWGEMNPQGEKPIPGMLWSDEVTINRGDDINHQWTNVPVGNVLVQATCFDQTDAQGNLVAVAEDIVVVQPNQTTDVSLVTDRLAEFIRIVDVPAPPGGTTPELAPLTMEPGDTKDIQARGYDYDGYQCLNVSFGWSVDEKAVLGLNPTTGNPVALSANEDGQFTVTCIDAKSGQQDTLDVTVQSRVAASVEIDPMTMLLYRFGSPEQMAITPTAKDGSGVAIPYATFTFQSNNNAVATVDATGLVTAQGPGECQITVKAHTATTTTDPATTCEVTVLDTGGMNVIVQ